MTTVENCQNIPSNNKTRKENAENNVYVKMKFQSFLKLGRPMNSVDSYKVKRDGKTDRPKGK